MSGWVGHGTGRLEAGASSAEWTILTGSMDPRPKHIAGLGPLEGIV